MKSIFEAKYAGVPIKYKFRHNSTARFFAGYIHLSESDSYDVNLDDDKFELLRKAHAEDISDDYVEYKGLIYLTAKKLLLHKRCIFHAVSFFWKGKAWLLTGESGIGKTTQFLNWNNVFPNEIVMISGDMPVLDFSENQIVINPSPWNGKERMQGTISAKLGGIVILQQSNDNNTIELADVKDSIITLFYQFAVIPENEEEIRLLAEMVQNVIEEVPIWVFSNDGSVDSSRILRNEILEYLDKENQTR